MLNLVIITSVINAFVPSVYSSGERLEQTLRSIQTVKDKIPNCYIVLLEGSELNEDQSIILQNKTDELSYINVSGLPKSVGELTLLDSYLNCENFNTIKDKINSLSKLSGRYYLNDNFKFVDNDLCMVKKTDKSWSGRGTYDTRFYKIPKISLNNYVTKIKQVYLNRYNIHDIEHGFYEYQVILKDNITLLDKLGVSGNYAPSGGYVED
jgi:hypothetical protein